ncbi:MAG: thioredoxin TrxC [Nitratireductor sp.]|nr:thioredoxin TrxC [Nitratireductor sp.]
MSDHHIVCSHCGSVNRIPPAKSALAAKCGKCGDPLFEATPVDVPANVFQRQISRSSVPVLVDVWAPWCGPCRMMAPAFQSAAEQLEPAVRLIKLNSDEQQQIAGQLGIRSIPTMILFHHGREVARQSGAMAAGQIVQWARQAAAKAA